MSIASDSMPRRKFLSHVTTGGAAMSAVALMNGVPLAQAQGSHVPSPAQATETWDLSWIDRINRPHRLVIDPTGSGEMAMGQLSNWMQGFADAYGKTDADLNGVVVFRHEAVGVVLNDAMQTRLGRSNNSLSQTMERYMARGVIVLACNMALRGQSHSLSQRESIDQAEAHKQIRAAVRPGVYVMPNGVFAIGRAQDAGCGYLRA
jgi:intracellular sulfur oxidation DsrE/DsrF family protein